VRSSAAAMRWTSASRPNRCPRMTAQGSVRVPRERAAGDRRRRSTAGRGQPSGPLRSASTAAGGSRAARASAPVGDSRLLEQAQAELVLPVGLVVTAERDEQRDHGGARASRRRARCARRHKHAAAPVQDRPGDAAARRAATAAARASRAPLRCQPER
jgi:hypothetical protein